MDAATLPTNHLCGYDDWRSCHLRHLTADGNHLQPYTGKPYDSQASRTTTTPEIEPDDMT